MTCTPARSRFLLIALVRLGFLGSFGLIRFGFCGSLFGFLNRKLAPEQLNDCQISPVTLAISKFDNAGIAAIAVRKPDGDGIKELLQRRGLQQKPRSLTAGVKTASLAQSDELFRDRPHLLGFLNRRGHTLMLKQRGAQV